MNVKEHDDLEYRIERTLRWQADQVDTGSVPPAAISRQLSAGLTPTAPNRRRRNQILVAAAGVCCLTAGALALAIRSDEDGAVETATEEFADEGDAAGYDWTIGDTGSEAINCVAVASPETLRDRDFAFDGEVIERLDDVGAGRDAGGAIGQVVRFRVEEWFIGGDAAEAVVVLQRSSEVGERLLVAGELDSGSSDVAGLAWECGFTTERTEVAREVWQRALSE